MAMQTILEDKVNHVVHVDTALPITHKTDEQKAFIQDRVAGYTVQPEASELNFHSAQPLAFQEVNLAYHEQLLADARRLPAQMRNHFPVTVKNGYVTRQDTFFEGDEQSTPVWGVRSATMPYLGKGESSEEIQTQVGHNFAQMRLALREYGAGEPQLHFMILNTNTSLEKQDRMISHTVAGAQASQVAISQLPLNIHGTLEGATLAPDIAQHTTYTSHLYIPFDKARSLDVATRTAGIARQQGKVNAVACASGQDRTGTLEESDAMEISYEAYAAHHISVDRESIAQLRAHGGHNAMLSSFSVPGSPGMKPDSVPGSYFSPTVTHHLYLESANSNKKIPIAHAGVEAVVVKAPNPKLVDDYIATAEQIRKFANRKNWNPFLWKDQKKTEALHVLARLFEAEATETGTKRTRAQLISSWEGETYKNKDRKKDKSKDATTGETYGSIIKRRRFTILSAKDAKSNTESFVDSLSKPPKKSS
jgi:hypothetical protein